MKNIITLSIVYIFVVSNLLFGQHSEKILKYAGYEGNSTEAIKVFGYDIFSNPYNLTSVAQFRSGGGYHLLLFAVDPDVHRIIGISIAVNSSLDYISSESWSKSYGDRSSDVKFKNPRGIDAVVYDANNVEVYVADTGNNRIVELRWNIITRDVTFIRNIIDDVSGGLKSPYDVEYDPYTSFNGSSDDRLLVADRDNHRIAIFTMQSGVWKYSSSVGSFGSGLLQFKYPTSVAVRKTYDNVEVSAMLVSDVGNSRVIYHNQISGRFDTYSLPSGSLVNCVESDLGGNLLATDSRNDIILKINPARGYLADFGGFGKGGQRFTYPMGISIPFALRVIDPINGDKIISTGIYVTENWFTDSGFKVYTEGVDVLNLSSTLSSDRNNVAIQFNLPTRSFVTINLRDKNGNLVKTLRDRDALSENPNWIDTWPVDWSIVSPDRYKIEVIAESRWKDSDGNPADKATVTTDLFLYYPLTTNMDGPGSVFGTSGIEIYTAQVGGGSGSFSYQWYVMPQNSNIWKFAGTNVSQGIGWNNTDSPYYFQVKLDVKDNITGITQTVTRTVTTYKTAFTEDFESGTANGWTSWPQTGYPPGIFQVELEDFVPTTSSSTTISSRNIINNFEKYIPKIMKKFLSSDETETVKSTQTVTTAAVGDNYVLSYYGENNTGTKYSQKMFSFPVTLENTITTISFDFKRPEVIDFDALVVKFISGDGKGYQIYHVGRDIQFFATQLGNTGQNIFENHSFVIQNGVYYNCSIIINYETFQVSFYINGELKGSIPYDKAITYIDRVEFWVAEAHYHIDNINIIQQAVNVPDALTLQNETVTGVKTYRAKNLIEAAGLAQGEVVGQTKSTYFTVESSANATFHVINDTDGKIVLKKGFTAKLGSGFRAYRGQGVTSNAVAMSTNSVENVSGKSKADKNKELAKSLLKDKKSVPTEYNLSANYPNPFNPTTTIQYDLPFNSDVTIKIYDILGREIRSLINGKLRAGYHSVMWDGKNEYAVAVSSGIYFYRIRAKSFEKKGQIFVKVRKMLLLK